MDQQKANDLVVRLVGDIGGTFATALCYIGDKLGLFETLAAAGPLKAKELAEKTNLNERYVLEWARGMVASQYAEYDFAGDKFFMTPEQKAIFVDKNSPMYCAGPIRFAIPTVLNVPKLVEVFKHGGGIPYSEIGEEIPAAIEEFFRPGYEHSLVDKWLPAVPGLPQKLRTGAKILDVGCGCGQSTVAMAKAFPQSKVTGIDYDNASLNRARDLAESRSLNNVSFVQSEAHVLPQNEKYDLVCAFDCIHDMAQPRATLKAICGSLSDDGIFLWGEPRASRNPMENRNPIAREFACCSPLHCLTVSLAYKGEGLGTVIGEDGARELAQEAGFAKIETLPIDDPFNYFYAARR
jgi:2-polyprenyl-3-methyl-5-hydroxy-6-metoxy-1,4-benzoquinol methylase